MSEWTQDTPDTECILCYIKLWAWNGHRTPRTQNKFSALLCKVLSCECRDTGHHGHRMYPLLYEVLSHEWTQDTTDTECILCYIKFWAMSIEWMDTVDTTDTECIPCYTRSEPWDRTPRTQNKFSDLLCKVLSCEWILDTMDTESILCYIKFWAMSEWTQWTQDTPDTEWILCYVGPC